MNRDLRKIKLESALKECDSHLARLDRGYGLLRAFFPLMPSALANLDEIGVESAEMTGGQGRPGGTFYDSEAYISAGELKVGEDRGSLDRRVSSLYNAISGAILGAEQRRRGGASFGVGGAFPLEVLRSSGYLPERERQRAENSLFQSAQQNTSPKPGVCCDRLGGGDRRSSKNRDRAHGREGPARRDRPNCKAVRQALRARAVGQDRQVRKLVPGHEAGIVRNRQQRD